MERIIYANVYTGKFKERGEIGSPNIFEKDPSDTIPERIANISQKIGDTYMLQGEDGTVVTLPSLLTGRESEFIKLWTDKPFPSYSVAIILEKTRDGPMPSRLVSILEEGSFEIEQ